MSRLRFTELAVEDLEEIHDYVAARNLEAALRLIERIEERCRQIADTPGIGRSREDLALSLRSLPEGSYVIFYRPLEDGAQIVRVRHGARNIEHIFWTEGRS